MTAERTEPNLIDLYQTFCDHGIDQNSLLDYFQNVDTGPPISPLPSLPVSRPHTHVNNGNEVRIVRKKTPHVGVVNFDSKMEDGSAGEEMEDEEEEETIPGYLPPLPDVKIYKGM